MKFIVLALAVIGAVSGYAVDKNSGAQQALLQPAPAHGAPQPAVVIGVPTNNPGHGSNVELAYGVAPSIIVPARPAGHYATGIPIQSIAAAQGAAVSQAYTAGYQQGLANSQAAVPIYTQNWQGAALPGHPPQAPAVQATLVTAGYGKY